MLDIRSFQNFIAVIELGSFSRAAEAVRLTQPGLSQQIASLEQYFGVPLLHRTPKGVTPTEEGLALEGRLRAILGYFEAARADIASLADDPRGVVAIGFPNSVAEILSLPLLDRAKKLFPGIELKISSLPNRIIGNSLSDNRINLGIILGSDFGKNVKSATIGQESFYFLTSPSSSMSRNSDEVSAEELRSRQLVLHCGPNHMRALVDAYMIERGFKLDVVAEVDSISNLLELAATGRYETIMPWSAAFRDVSAGRIVARPMPSTIRRDLSICVSPSAPLSNASVAILRLLATTVTELVDQEIWRGVELADARGTNEIEALLNP